MVELEKYSEWYEEVNNIVRWVIDLLLLGFLLGAGFSGGFYFIKWVARCP